MNKNMVFKYLLITFLISWICWITVALLCNYGLMKYGQLSFMIIYVLGRMAPLVSTLITVRQNKSDFEIFKKQIFNYKLNVLWYVGILILPLIISGVSWLFNLLITGKTVLFLSKPFYMVLLFLPSMIIGGGLEEVGWRGMLLPQLLKKISPLKAILIISVIWTLWHVPLWLIPGVPQYRSNFIIFLINIVSLTFLLSTIYIKTQSILMCILFHATENAFSTYMGINFWANSLKSQLANGVLSLIFSIINFFVFYKLKPKEINYTTKHNPMTTNS